MQGELFNPQLDMFDSRADAPKPKPVVCLGMEFPDDEARRGYTGVNGATCPMRWSRCSDESEPGFRRGSHCRKLPVRMKRRVQ